MWDCDIILMRSFKKVSQWRAWKYKWVIKAFGYWEDHWSEYQGKRRNFKTWKKNLKVSACVQFRPFMFSVTWLSSILFLNNCSSYNSTWK